DDEALDELGYFRAHHMGAEQLAAPGIEDGLDHALILAKCDGLAVAEEGEAADPDFAAFGFGLRFSEPDGGDLGMAIGAARNPVPVDRMVGASLDLFVVILVVLAVLGVVLGHGGCISRGL